MEQRLNRLRTAMQAQSLPAMLVLRPENRFYLSGFTGSNGYLVVTQDEAIFLTDFRYTDQAQTQCTPHCRVETVTNAADAVLTAIAKELADKGIHQLGFEQDFLSYASYQFYANGLSGVELVPTEGLVEELRLIKEERELAILRQAAKIADDAFAHVLNVIRPGIPEKEIALELEFFMRKAGASAPSFNTIVASGKRSALPHGRASEKILEAGDFVTLDFGAYYQGYCSDITRTVVLGQASDRQREIYNLVLEAQQYAIKHIKAGMTGVEADALARDIIAGKGYGDAFGHSLGHGLGLQVHEAPSLSVRGNRVLQPGMVVTVEPGIYLSDWGGVRIEDDIVVTETGNLVLTQSPKELLILG